MARPIVLGNGEMHVGINNYGLLHDLYFPYVGLENHTIGKGTRHRVGIWVDGALSWMDDGDWKITFEYPHMALVGHITARCDKLDITLEFDDAVDAEMTAFMRNIHVINTSRKEREIRVFTHQAFVIGDSRANTDTAQYLPDNCAVMHYRGRRVFIVSGECEGGPFDQFTTGLFGIEGREGSWKDAEDGELSMCSAEHGRVDSVLRFRKTVGPLSSFRVHYWIAVATSLRQAIHTHKTIQSEGVVARLHTTSEYWHKWLEPAMETADTLPAQYRKQFLQSAMIIKSHIDNRGAVIASTDSAMLNYGRDAYAYCWPRDGAYVLWPLLRMGYRDELLRYFNFCRRVLHPNGYLSHKFRADGALGSSWHTYLHGETVSPPIQQDETALVLFLFAQFYHFKPDAKLIAQYYDSLVVPMADFLASNNDRHTNLPRPSYDLWEEVFATTTYSTAVTYGALIAAAGIAEAKGDETKAVEWRTVADEISEAAKKHLFDTEKGCVVKSITSRPDGTVERDNTIDLSAVFGSFMYGLFAPESEEISRSVETSLRVFDQKTRIGLPRYEHDMYRRVPGSPVPNSWHITTLWYAQYCIEIEDTETAAKLLCWVQEHAYGSGVLAEQIKPNGYSTSVAPLVWSHAEFMATLLDTMNVGFSGEE